MWNAINLKAIVRRFCRPRWGILSNDNKTVAASTWCKPYVTGLLEHEYWYQSFCISIKSMRYFTGLVNILTCWWSKMKTQGVTMSVSFIWGPCISVLCQLLQCPFNSACSCSHFQLVKHWRLGSGSEHQIQRKKHPSAYVWNAPGRAAARPRRFKMS